MFEIDDNNRKFLSNTPHVLNMIALALTVKKNRGHVTVFRK